MWVFTWRAFHQACTPRVCVDVCILPFILPLPLNKLWSAFCTCGKCILQTDSRKIYKTTTALWYNWLQLSVCLFGRIFGALKDMNNVASAIKLTSKLAILPHWKHHYFNKMTSKASVTGLACGPSGHQSHSLNTKLMCDTCYSDWTWETPHTM